MHGRPWGRQAEAEHSQPSAIAIAPEEVGQASENTTYNASAEEETNAVPPGVEAQHLPSHHSDTPSLRPDEGGLPERVECGENASESDGDDETDLPRAEMAPKISREIHPADVPRLSEDKESEQNRAEAQDAQSSQRECNPVPLHRRDAGIDGADNGKTELGSVMPRSSRTRHARRTRIVNYNEDSEDEVVEAGERLISQKNLRRRRRRRESAETEDMGVYQPAEASEQEQDGNDGDDSDKDAPPPHKRRRTARRRGRSVDNAPTRRDVRDPNPAWEHFTPPHILTPPHSQDSDSSEDNETVQVPAARFQEWPLGNAVLKRVVINGQATFQLQFTWDPCTNDKHKASTVKGVQSNILVKSCRSTRRKTATRRKTGSRSSWTHEEEEFLIELKKEGLTWNNIHKRHKEAFPERSVGTLQVHYCTKLKGRQQQET